MKSSITVKYINEGEFRRYYIHDRVGQYWNGQEWVYQPQDALIYEKLQICHEDYQRLITENYKNKPVQHFKVLTYVIVRSDVPVSKKQVRHWLNKAYRGIADTEACGDGPIPESLALIRTDFNHIKEHNPKPG